MISIELSREKTSRSNLIAAFKQVIKRAGRPRATDLHFRRLLLYVQAKDHDGTGLHRSLLQLADKLFLTVSTCRRVIRRAVKHFGLLTVISQRHTPGGQTVNRYAINWEHVDALLCDKDRENALTPANTDMPVRLALPVGSLNLSVSRATLISRSRMPVRLALSAMASLSPDLPQLNFTPDALSEQPPKNFPDSLPVQLGPTASAPATTDQPPSNLGSCADSHLDANATISPSIVSNDNHDAPALCDHPVDLSNRPPLDFRVCPPVHLGPTTSAPATTDQPPALPMPVHNLSKFGFTPLSFTPDALSDQPAAFKSRSRSKRATTNQPVD